MFDNFTIEKNPLDSSSLFSGNLDPGIIPSIPTTSTLGSTLVITSPDSQQLSELYPVGNFAESTILTPLVSDSKLDSSSLFGGNLDPGIIPSIPTTSTLGSTPVITFPDSQQLSELYPVGNFAEPTILTPLVSDSNNTSVNLPGISSELSLNASLTADTPDLIINSISATSATVGDYLHFTYNIKNQGAGNSGANYTGFYLSTDTTLNSSDTYLGFDHVNYLAAGSSSTESASIYLSSGLSVGTYYLFTIADGWGYVSESDETNNGYYQAITIAGPDLIINSISATSATAGNYLDFTYNIKNQGARNAGANYTGFYLSTDTTLDSGDTYLGFDYVNSLAAGSSSTESASIYLSSGLSLGTYYLFTKADGWGYVSESDEDETNNGYYQAITIAGPDLIINSISATSATAGNYLDFTYNIKNQGARNAGANYTGFYLSTDTTLDSGDTYLGFDYVNSLAAGSSSTESASISLSSSLSVGTYYLFTIADGWGYVSESNETNNGYYQAITVVEASKPDLIINSISATSATAGNYLDFTYNIKNQGAGNAGANYTGFYLSTDTTLDSGDTYLGFDYVNSLAAGSSSTESASIYLSSGLSLGTYYLFTIADGWGYVSESDETNNGYYQAITIADPDLIINSISATSATAGNYLDFTYNIKNQGAGNAGANYTGFYLSTDTTLDSGDTYLGFDYVNSLAAGSSSTESASIYLSSGLSLGTYYLFTIADGWGYVSESDETNNGYYQAITIAGSDLIINSISATSATAGNYLDFTYNIKNQGAGNSGANYTGFYLSTDTTLDSGDTYLGFDYVNSLAAGSSSTESASIYLSSGLSLGTYYLFTIADGWGYVSESDETNNGYYQAITIAGPDLIINSISATSATAGNYLDFTYSIKNQGAGNAGANYTGFYLSTDTTLDSGDTYLGFDYVNSLAAGSSSTESASIYLSSGLSLGTYYLFTKADGWGYVSESDETNNGYYQAITIAGPDLIINSISATSATAGNYLDFTYNIKNQGAGNAGANYTGFYLSTDTTLDSGDTYLGFDYVNSLAAGSSSTESASIYLSSGLSLGTYYLFTIADGWGYVSESDETNNGYYQAITIAGPDLIINSISATSATAGNYLDFTYSIKNQGAGNAGANYTGFYLSTDTTLDSGDTYLGFDYVNSLAAGSSSTESASIYLSSGLSLGTYYLFTIADGWGYVSESDETNNGYYQAITVVEASKPDLIINSISATSATAGTSLNFTYNIKNQGAGNAGANYTGFYLSTDTTLDSSDTYLGLDDVNVLTSGSSSTESASFNLSQTLAAGNYYLFAKADGGSTITESDEINNVYYQAITVVEASKPDLIINSISATSATAGTSLNFTYNIKNQGAGNAGANYTGFYLSTDTTLDSGDTYLGLDDVNVLTSGSSSTESASFNLSQTLAAGNYYLFAKADGGNAITESDETNNVYYQAITVISGNNTDWFSINLRDAQLITLTRSLATDGNLSRNDMIALFRDAKDSAVIDANELTDLRTIVSNATLFTMQDYVRVLSDYVVNGNTANQWWTGGGTTRTSLGNLYAGSSDIQMEKLVGKWFLGTDRPDLRTEGDIANQGSGSYTGTKTYRAVSGSLFQNGISADDVKQGAVGDCYYVATLSSIAMEKPNYIQNMFIDNGDNTYTVRFFNNGVANYVTVDNYLPTNSSGSLIYASSGQSYNNSNNELWVALAEKAYAQLAESGWSRPSNVNNGYGSIEGGWMDYVIKQITGLNSTFNSILNMNETQLINLVNSNQILTAGFVNGGGYGVYNSHAYTITAYNSTTGKFNLRNPWATSHADVTWAELTTLKAYIIYSNT